MRAVLLVTAVLASGCSLMLRPASVSPSSNSASLTFRDAHSKPFGELDGIWYVDEYRFKTPQTRIYITPGRRSVGYQCPGWMSMDDFASVQYAFDGGKSYEMVCEDKGPVIHPLSGSGA